MTPNGRPSGAGGLAGLDGQAGCDFGPRVERCVALVLDADDRGGDAPEGNPDNCEVGGDRHSGF